MSHLEPNHKNCDQFRCVLKSKSQHIENSRSEAYLLDFFCSDIQFNVLLSPFLCFVSFLYLDLFVLRDDALIS